MSALSPVCNGFLRFTAGATPADLHVVAVYLDCMTMPLQVCSDQNKCNQLSI